MPRYLIETHAHTNIVSPCSRLSPRTLVKRYHLAGYSGIVVTDHLTVSLPIFRQVDSWRERVHRFFSGFRRVRDLAKRFGLVVYPGFELSYRHTQGSDFLVYGIDETLLAEMPEVYDLDPAEFRKLADEVGAIVFRAHPFRNGNRSVTIDYVHGIEVYNGNPRHDSRNDLAVAYIAANAATRGATHVAANNPHAASNPGTPLLASSGSDAHQLEDIGRGGISTTVLPADSSELARLWRESSDDIELIMGPQRVESLT